MYVYLIAMPCVHLLVAQGVTSACWCTTSPAALIMLVTVSLAMEREKGNSVYAF